jgi:hypothetical protein
MSFGTVINELGTKARAVQANRNKPAPLSPSALLSDADIARWAFDTGLARGEIYDRIAIWIARGFCRSELSFEFCDRIVNDIHGVIMLANEHRPKLFWEVFLAFDSGEFYRSNDRTRDPVDEFTRPLISVAVETYALDYPDIP